MCCPDRACHHYVAERQVGAMSDRRSELPGVMQLQFGVTAHTSRHAMSHYGDSPHGQWG